MKIAISFDILVDLFGFVDCWRKNLIEQSATASDSSTFAYGDLLKVLIYPSIGTFVNWHIP